MWMFFLILEGIRGRLFGFGLLGFRGRVDFRLFRVLISVFFLIVVVRVEYFFVVFWY